MSLLAFFFGGVAFAANIKLISLRTISIQQFFRFPLFSSDFSRIDETFESFPSPFMTQQRQLAVL